MAQKRKRSKKWIYYLVMFVLLIAAGVTVYLVWDNYFHDKKDNEIQEPDKAVISESALDTETEAKEDKGDSESDDKRPVQYEGEDPNIKEELSGSITYAGLIDDRIAVRMNIDQYLGEGECTIHFMNNGVDSYKEITNITSSAATATCEGFDIPVNNIASGKYEILIELSSGGKTGTIKGEINI